MPESKLRVLLDQNIPQEIRLWLQEQKPQWTVWHVNEVSLYGASDSKIFLWAQEKGSIIVSFDEDFADTRSFPLGSHHGVIRLRVWPTTVENTKEALERLIRSIPDDSLRESLVIVHQDRIRIRSF